LQWKPGEDTVGLLGRLRVRSKRLIRIGKEIDRLGGDEGASLEAESPIEYERDNLAENIAYLGAFPRAATARDVGVTDRGWRKIVKGECAPKPATVERIQEIATAYRTSDYNAASS
jgi:hypothetical protein